MSEYYFDLAVRTTRKYSVAWSDLDAWFTLGRCKVKKCLPERISNHDTRTQLLLLSVEAPGYRRANIERAIRDTFVKACRCEHDCCGHLQTQVHRIRGLSGGEYAVKLFSYRNI